MKIYCELEKEELFSSFSFAKAFYDSCISNLIDVKTVAKMMLLEADSEKRLKRGEINDRK